MKVALVHDWLTSMRGGERCLEAFCELFPGADIYTLLHVPKSVTRTIEDHPIRTSFIQQLPFHRRAYRYYLPLFPSAVESFKILGYDLILSSSHCVAKGVKIPAGVCHISYVHTPMRYIWDQHDAYFKKTNSGGLVRTAMAGFRPWLTRWDTASSRTVDYFVANSHFVAERIQRYYGRTADVIHPPVDLNAFSLSNQDEGYYLLVTAFAPYKRVDLAIAAFNQLKWPLKIIGSGQEEKYLRQMAGPTIEFLGWQSNTEVCEAYAKCRALIFPGEEDFGIVPLEAMATGKAVVAYGRGGVLETVVPLAGSDDKAPGSRVTRQAVAATPERSGVAHATSWNRHRDAPAKANYPTGVFFYDQTPEAIIDAVRYFEAHRDAFNPDKIRDHVKPFDREVFKRNVETYVRLKFEEFQNQRHA